MGLRDYQVAALESIVRADAEGCKRGLVILPTGTGKTQIASSLPEAIGLNGWEVMAFIVAQEELAFQAMESLQRANPTLRVTLEKAEHHGDIDADIVVASIDTLSRSEGRLAAFAEIPFRVIFLDECHAAVSPKYLKVLRELRVLKGEDNVDPQRLLIGLTATPKRFDGLALERIFDKIVFRRGIREMVEQKWIADPVAYRIETGLGLDDIQMRQGDFATGALSQKVNTPTINALIVQKYLQYGKGLPAIAFTVDIDHSECLADVFRHHGLAFEAISSNTPKARRKELVEAHRNMDILGLASCQALLTGFDSPPATVALFARPTCSSLLYTQALGRVLRPYPAPESAATHTGYVKTNAIILDFVGASSKHRLFTASTLFGLNPQFDPEGKSITRAVAAMEDLQKQNPTLDIAAYAGLDDARAAAVSVDMWKPAPIPKLAKSCSQFIWMMESEDVYRLSAPGLSVYLTLNHLGQYEVFRQADGAEPDMRMIFDDPEDGFSFADSLVPVEFVPLIRANARWRKQTPSKAQAILLWRKDPVIRKRFGSGEAFHNWACHQVEYTGNQSFSKGALSMRIDILKRAKSKFTETIS
jgi:ATP-dependent helicase IRC3